jgi:hypothetical protein
MLATAARREQSRALRPVEVVVRRTDAAVIHDRQCIESSEIESRPHPRGVRPAAELSGRGWSSAAGAG